MIAFITSRKVGRTQARKLMLIKELKEIRVRLTAIYMELGNPSDKGADMILNRDIVKLENEV